MREHLSNKHRRCTNYREEGHNRKCSDSQGTQPVGNANYGDSEDDNDYDDGEDHDVDVDS